MFHISIVVATWKIKHWEDIYQTQIYIKINSFFTKLKSELFFVKKMKGMKLHVKDVSIIIPYIYISLYSFQSAFNMPSHLVLTTAL